MDSTEALDRVFQAMQGMERTIHWVDENLDDPTRAEMRWILADLISACCALSLAMAGKPEELPEEWRIYDRQRELVRKSIHTLATHIRDNCTCAPDDREKLQ